MLRRNLSIIRTAGLLLATMHLQHAIGIAQGLTETDAHLRRATRIKNLHGELFINDREDERRVTKEYAEAHLSEIRALVQEEILASLAQTDKPDVVRKALRATLGKTSESAANPDWPFVYSVDLRGLKAVVIGYNVRYGGGLPISRVIIEGYRKVGSGYELAANGGDSIENCDLTLSQLNSPRGNEAWFLAHGQLYGPMDYQEVVRLYSFDGYKFKELWAPSKTKFSPNYLITSDTVTLTYFSEFMFDDLYHKRQERLQDTIRLTSGGPVVSTVRLPQ